MIYVFLADGFEECEALVPVDILRRAGFDVITVGISSDIIKGSHNIPVVCDITEDKVVFDYRLEAIILPGGMPGTVNLEKSDVVQKAIDYAYENSLVIAAICAAPSILGHKNLLNGKKATCFAGFEPELYGAEIISAPVVNDGNIITSRGAGAAFDFGFEVLSSLRGKSAVNNMKKQMKYSD